MVWTGVKGSSRGDAPRRFLRDRQIVPCGFSSAKTLKKNDWFLIGQIGRSRNDTTSNVENGRHGQSCKSALHAGWVRSCLQDKSGRTNQACDWPTRTCNASGSRADCAAAGYRVKAGLPCERWLECNEHVFRLRLGPTSLFSLSLPLSLLFHLPLFALFLSLAIFVFTLPSFSPSTSPFSLLHFLLLLSFSLSFFIPFHSLSYDFCIISSPSDLVYSLHDRRDPLLQRCHDNIDSFDYNPRDIRHF